MMDTGLRTGTEASAIGAISLATALAVSGAYIPALVAGGIGVVLLVIYEAFGIDGIEVTEDEVKRIAEGVGDVIQEEEEVTEDVDFTEN